MVPTGKTGHSARLFRHGQCWGGRHQICSTVCHGGDGLERSRSDMGCCAGCYGSRVFPVRKGRSRLRRAQAKRRQAQITRRTARTLAASAGLAFLALLFLRLRGLRRAGAVAAQISKRSLSSRCQGCGHARRHLLALGEPVPRLWRDAVGQIWRAQDHVRDLWRVDALPVHAQLSVDRLCDPRDQGRHRIFDLDGAGTVS